MQLSLVWAIAWNLFSKEGSVEPIILSEFVVLEYNFQLRLCNPIFRLV